MLSLLFALTAAAGAPEAAATLQSCEMTPAGWVCTYKMPPVTLVALPPTTAVVDPSAPPSAPVVPTTVMLPPPITAPNDAQAIREAKLIARCADASWFSLCLPDDRREARRLRDAADARTALRGKVTGLISDGKCDEAIKTALAASDLGLAREAREFCRL